MLVNLGVKHDIEARKAAIGLFERGHGFESAAKAPSVPRDTVRQRLYVYRSFGSEALLSMDGKQTGYTYGRKVAAASAVVAAGMGGQDATREFGVMSLARSTDGAGSTARAAPRRSGPKPKGRPRGPAPGRACAPASWGSSSAAEGCVSQLNYLGFHNLLFSGFTTSGEGAVPAPLTFRPAHHEGLLEPPALPAELDEASVVHDAVDGGRRQVRVAEHRPPLAELDVGGDDHAPALVRGGHDLVQ